MINEFGTREVTKDEKTMALLAHLSVLVFPVIAPLILWAVKKDESKFIAYHALQAAIFQAITYPILIVLIIFLMIVTLGLCFPAPMLAMLPSVAGILWGLKANEGKWEGYPLIDSIGR